MATPSGQIAFSQVNLELGVSPTSSQANLGSAPFRGLAGVPSGQISMSNLQNKSNVKATGGTEIDSGGYRIHVFTSPGSFVVVSPSLTSVEYLVVAGGGAGGPGNPASGGGGGAGGFRTATGFPVTATTYPITVGGGGSPSIFSSITSTAGGAGGAYASSGSSGGSGGGGGGTGAGEASSGGAGNTPPTSPSQGNPGAGRAPGSSYYLGGGGGGAGSGATPNPASTDVLSPGGIGSPISWLPASYGTPGPAPGRYFAGGGGGGAGPRFTPSPSFAPGGAGGGAKRATGAREHSPQLDDPAALPPDLCPERTP